MHVHGHTRTQALDEEEWERGRERERKGELRKREGDTRGIEGKHGKHVRCWKPISLQQVNR